MSLPSTAASAEIEEIKRDKRDDLFAATPPLEAKKMLMSLAVTQGVGYINNRREGMKLDFIDVKRAYFHAKCKRDVYVQLPKEDAEEVELQVESVAAIAAASSTLHVALTSCSRPWTVDIVAVILPQQAKWFGSVLPN